MIAPINNIIFHRYVKQQNQQQNNISVKTPLMHDTVSFGHKDLLTETENTIHERLQNSFNTKNLIGEGGEATVYKIDDTEYCLRLVHEDEMKIPRRINFAISEQDKINHVVAKLGSNGSSIMKFIEGTPVWAYNMTLKEKQQIAEEITKIPVESFHKLIKQISHAYNHNMMFDCNWSNVIVNPKTKTLTAIDFNKMSSPELLNLLNYTYTSLTHADTSLAQKKTYAGKLFLAGLKEFEPKTKPCLNPADFDFNRFVHKLYDQKVLDNENYRKILTDLFSRICDLKYQEIQNPNNISELNGKLKIAKSLIKQLFNVV